MPVTQILLLRHGHRLAWTLDPSTGVYSSSHPFPTKLPADPPLAAHGQRQAVETAEYLSHHLRDIALDGRLRIYSSLFYRCLETLRPTVEALCKQVHESRRTVEDEKKILRGLQVRGERGLGEWFGKAWFNQPVPATSERLQRDFFPWVDSGYESLIVPERQGELIAELHERVARALASVIRDVDAEFERMGKGEEEVTVLMCGHAAQIIASGRALTGQVPGDYDEEDFKCFTCGISRFVRRESGSVERDKEWRTKGVVGGGWDCVDNSACGHLSQGEERGWHFHGDESFDSYGPGQLKTSDGVVRDKRKTKVEDSNEGSSKL